MSDNRTASNSPVATEAAEWYARMRAPDVSEIEAVRFRAWLSGDPERRQEFDAVDAFWADLSAIEHSPEVKRVREGIASRRSKKRWPGYLAMAATFLAAVGGAWTTWQHWGAGHYVTGVGEQRMVPLSDGSVVTLNTATEIRLKYSGSAREIQLLRGQANFDVARDPSRPFIVTAGGGAVRALGTVFDVYKSNDKVTVTLIEGKVAVTPSDSSLSGPSVTAEGVAKSAIGTPAEKQPIASEVILAAGEQLSYGAVARSSGTPVVKVPDVVKLASADVPRVTAWRARKLDFSDTPLVEAIDEANRYSREQIVLEAPELARARISGTFKAGNNEAFVEGLQAYFHLSVERESDGKLVLKQKSN